MKYFDLIKDGIIRKNPVFVQLLALCPLLAVTTSAINAIIMGLATTAVMICASSVISIVRKLIPGEIRIAAAVIIVAGFVTILQLCLDAYVPPNITAALGIYIPLIVVNCIVFARLESFASKNKLFPSMLDALSMGLGFTLGLFIIGVIREFLGKGSIFGKELLNDPMLIMGRPAGAFFTLGVIIMIGKQISIVRSRMKTMKKKRLDR
ncbi:MAG: electron transport complex subunit RsxE [Treponema sp.]|jgi:electron transport complex protein RnfE|nr:electron transport complex subunit RsxE [Treponema sp.]